MTFFLRFNIDSEKLYVQTFILFLFSAIPIKATAVFGECSFDRDLCGYRNQSGKGPLGDPSKAALERKNPNRLTVLKDSVTWKLATPNSRPANLQDHTFRAPSKFQFSNIYPGL